QVAGSTKDLPEESGVEWVDFRILVHRPVLVADEIRPSLDSGNVPAVREYASPPCERPVMDDEVRRRVGRALGDHGLRFAEEQADGTEALFRSEEHTSELLSR